MSESRELFTAPPWGRIVPQEYSNLPLGLQAPFLMWL